MKRYDLQLIAVSFAAIFVLAGCGSSTSSARKEAAATPLLKTADKTVPTTDPTLPPGSTPPSEAPTSTAPSTASSPTPTTADSNVSPGQPEVPPVVPPAASITRPEGPEATPTLPTLTSPGLESNCEAHGISQQECRAAITVCNSSPSEQLKGSCLSILSHQWAMGVIARELRDKAKIPPFLHVARETPHSGSPFGINMNIEHLDVAKNYCSNRGGRLANIRELVKLAMAFGAKGIVDSCDSDSKCVTFRVKNLDGSIDTFNYSSSGFKTPEGRLNHLWSSTFFSSQTSVDSSNMTPGLSIIHGELAYLQNNFTGPVACVLGNN